MAKNNIKLNKIVDEIIKTKTKIAELQCRLRELETQKTNEQNSELVGIIRESNISAEKLANLIKAYKDGSIDLTSLGGGKDETKNES